MSGEACDAGRQWWLRPSDTIAEIWRRAQAASIDRAYYRFGDSFLEIDSDDGPLLQTLKLWYGECAVPELNQSEAQFRCSVRSLDDPPLILVSFQRPDDTRDEAAALGVFQSLRRANYFMVDCPVPGWRAMYASRDAARPFMAAGGFDALFDVRVAPRSLPPGLLLSYIVSAVMGLQRDVLYVHAASIGIQGKAALLMGIGGAGKTTLSLALASRGHTFLGDNHACVRIKSREVLPFRRSAAIKTGPRARAIGELLKENPNETIRLPNGKTVTLMRVGDAFPSPESSAFPLAAFFYLRRFGERPIVEEFKPAMTNRAFLDRVAADPTAIAGVSPSRRLMNVMVLMELLADVPCFFVDAGGPDDTAALIEKKMETLWP